MDVRGQVMDITVPGTAILVCMSVDTSIHVFPSKAAMWKFIRANGPFNHMEYFVIGDVGTLGTTLTIHR